MGGDVVAVIQVSQPIDGGVVYKSVESENPEKVGEWAIDLFECGDSRLCLYSFLCVCPALGDIKNGLDGSHVLIGGCCFSYPAMRFLTRTAYNIKGNAHGDCWTGLFCPCCTANQLLHTVKARGRPNIPQVGSEFLLNERTGFKQRTAGQLVCDALYSFFCNPCAQGLNLQRAGVPWWFGCMCFNPFGANHVLRYHNRTRPLIGNECLVDYCVPAVFTIFNQATYGMSQPFIGWAYTFCNHVEENNRQGRTCYYGLDAISVLSCFCRWLCTCKCEQEEGRYLVKSTPVIY